MQTTVFVSLCFVVLTGGIVALLLEVTREKEQCYWHDGEVQNGQYVLYEEPVRVCDGASSGGNGSSNGKLNSLRRSSSSNSSGGWFRK